jgi:hypothetical protein
LQSLEGVETSAVDVQTWLENLELPWDHPDRADRTIVALVKRFNCSPITPIG